VSDSPLVGGAHLMASGQGLSGSGSPFPANFPGMSGVGGLSLMRPNIQRWMTPGNNPYGMIPHY
jgi:hypothetical protein